MHSIIWSDNCIISAEENFAKLIEFLTQLKKTRYIAGPVLRAGSISKKNGYPPMSLMLSSVLPKQNSHHSILSSFAIDLQSFLFWYVELLPCGLCLLRFDLIDFAAPTVTVLDVVSLNFFGSGGLKID